MRSATRWCRVATGAAVIALASLAGLTVLALRPTRPEPDFRAAQPAEGQPELRLRLAADAQREVVRSQEALADVEALQSSFADAQTGLLGSLLTRDVMWHERCGRAIETARSHVKRLRERAGGADRLERLVAIEEGLAVLGDTLARVRAGMAEAGPLLVDRIEGVCARAREVIARLAQVEGQHRREKIQALEVILRQPPGAEPLSWPTDLN